jgi:hypothetical protein
MSNRTYVIHKHVGSDTLEVEKNPIQDESWEQCRVCGLLNSTDVYQE